MADAGKYDSVEQALAAASEALNFNSPARSNVAYTTSERAATPGSEESAKARIAAALSKMESDGGGY